MRSVNRKFGRLLRPYPAESDALCGLSARYTDGPSIATKYDKCKMKMNGKLTPEKSATQRMINAPKKTG
jgi:hypothetical protein